MSVISPSGVKMPVRLVSINKAINCPGRNLLRMSRRNQFWESVVLPIRKRWSRLFVLVSSISSVPHALPSPIPSCPTRSTKAVSTIFVFVSVVTCASRDGRSVVLHSSVPRTRQPVKNIAVAGTRKNFPRPDQKIPSWWSVQVLQAQNVHGY